MAHQDPFADIWGPGGPPGAASKSSHLSPRLSSGGSQGRSPRATDYNSNQPTPNLSPRKVALSPRDEADSSRSGGGVTGVSKSAIAERMYKRMSEGDSGGAAQKRKAATSGGMAGGQNSRPKMLVCYLCGQQFGTKSLDIHQPQCYVKKLLQWEKNESAMRGPRPLSPEEYNDKLAAAGHDAVAVRQDVNKFNEVQFEGYTDQLVPCPNCNRTFLPDRLEVHSRSCKGPGRGSKPVRRVTASTSAARSSTGTVNGNDTSSPLRQDSPAAASSSPKRSSSPPIRPPPAMRSSDLYSQPPDGMEESLKSASPVARQNTVDPEESRSSRARTPSSAGNSSSPLRSQSPTISAKRSSAAKAPAAKSTTPRLSLHERMQANLKPCSFCGRTFAPDRIEKHESVCINQKTLKVGGPKVTTPPSTNVSVSVSNSSFSSAGGAQPSPTTLRRTDSKLTSMTTASAAKAVAPKPWQKKSAKKAEAKVAALAKSPASASTSASSTPPPPAAAGSLGVVVDTPSGSFTSSPPPPTSPLGGEPPGAGMTPAGSAEVGATASGPQTPSSSSSPKLSLKEARRQNRAITTPPAEPSSPSKAADDLDGTFSELQEQLKSMDTKRRTPHTIGSRSESFTLTGDTEGSPTTSPSGRAGGTTFESLPPPEVTDTARGPNPHEASGQSTPESITTPPLQPQSTAGTGVTAAGGTRRAKFCFECGTPLVVATQKFCTECGAKILSVG